MIPVQIVFVPETVTWMFNIFSVIKHYVMTELVGFVLLFR